jgi:hypothetical protein
MKTIVNHLLKSNRIYVLTPELVAMGVTARDIEVVNRLRYLHYQGYTSAKRFLRRFVESRMCA